MTRPSNDPPNLDGEPTEPSYEVVTGPPAELDDIGPEPAVPDGSQPESPPAPARTGGVPLWVQLGLVLVAVGIVIAVVLMPRAGSDDKTQNALGADGSQLRRIHDTFATSMTCDAGPITDERVVLACYEQTDQHVRLVFAQADLDGQVASYTAETRPLGGSPDQGEAIGYANQIASIVTPGTDFSGCTHDYSTPYYCFGTLAYWASETIAPVTSTGELQRLPDDETLGQQLAGAGLDCSFGVCSDSGGVVALTMQRTPTALGLQFTGPVDIEQVKAAAQVVLGSAAETAGLQEWAEGLDGMVSVITLENLVVGYLPQSGGRGLLVFDEIAGVLPGTA